jgi:8-oxo-dGTP diphosphatase
MLKVTCAIIIDKNKILVAQRRPDQHPPLKWEFPGGKISEGETKEECVIREIKEELDLDISPICELKSNIHHYEELSLELFPFVCICKRNDSNPICKEHQKLDWVELDELSKLDWACADIPIVDDFIKRQNEFID